MSIIVVIAFVTIGLAMYCFRNRWITIKIFLFVSELNQNKHVHFRIFWFLSSNKANRNVRTLEELLPNRDRDGYQSSPVADRDNFIINYVNHTVNNDRYDYLGTFNYEYFSTGLWPQMGVSKEQTDFKASDWWRRIW